MSESISESILSKKETGKTKMKYSPKCNQKKAQIQLTIGSLILIVIAIVLLFTIIITIKSFDWNCIFRCLK